MFSCTERNDTTLFRLLPGGQTGITFSNTITENDSINLLDYEYVYNGGGVAVIDVNADGLADLFFSGNMVPSRLYLNEGGLRFKDITAGAGISKNNWATGVAIADVNADGRQDIYVCSAGLSEERRANLLYINNGDNTFTERAAAYGVDDTGFSTMAAFFDYDRDGDLDLYVVTYANDTWDTSVIYPKVTDGKGKATDRLYRNNGNETFTNVSKEAGILIEGYGLGVSVCDINQDEWPDIYIANDYIDDDFIYINNQDGTFTESAAKYLNHISHFAMGCDIADINNDCYPDIMVVDMQPEDNARQKLFSIAKNYDKFSMTLKMGYLPAYMRNTLQLNNGNGTFSEIGQLAGVHHTDWSWAPLLADLDNDGYKDLFITNGYPKDIMNRDFLVYNKYATSIQSVKMPASLEEQHRFKLKAISELQGSKIRNYLFRNNGDLTFSKTTEDWGIGEHTFSNGAAYADLDNDGDLDLAVNNINDPASIYENRSEEIIKHNYIRLRLQGDSLNPFALGASVKLFAGKNGVQYLENSPYRGFQSTVEFTLHFGLGDLPSADSIEVRWPDGNYTTLKNIPANQVITARQEHAVAKSPVPKKQHENNRFERITSSLGIDYRHQEIDFNDFKIQPLLPHKYSQSGPGVAVADVNGDGLSDFYVGGARQFPGAIYLQTPEGEFRGEHFEQHVPSEDMGCLFFDADGDQDQDLYVVGGGNEEMAGAGYYQDRLYFNDGNGNFTHRPGALPRMSDSGSCVIGADYDQDGDMDLFVGGRHHPGKYPLPGKSYLLRNDGGKFQDVTTQAGGDGFARMGMVSSALWTDFDNDGLVDLMVAGEWMPVTFFRNQGGQFSNVTKALGLQHTTGWWNSLVSGDFDSDGDTDYVLGNTGKNSRYKPTPKEPLIIYTKDFDDNATLDPIFSYYIQGEHHVAHSRDELVGQISAMRKRYPGYEPFANAKFSEIFPERELEGSYILQSEIFESSYLRNDGNEKFTMKALPIQAQFAPVFGMSAFDADDDGNLDLLTVGNSYAAEISMGRYDAAYGCLLVGDGKGNFNPVSHHNSGFFVKGDAKGIATLINARQEALMLVTKNNGDMDAFVQRDRRHKAIRLRPMEAWAEIIFPGGRKRKQELHYGNTYLSQSDRVLILPETAVSVNIFTFSGEHRTVMAGGPEVVSRKAATVQRKTQRFSVPK